MMDGKSQFRLSENVWLTLIPIVATYLVFLFQGSYLAYFGVPVSLTDVDIPKIVFSMAALALAGMMLIALLSAVADILRSQNPIVQIVGKGLAEVTILLPFILAATNTYTARQQMTYGAFFFCLWLTNFLPPKQKIGESKSYLVRLKEREERYSKAINAEPRNIKQAIGANVLGPFALILLLSIYVMMLGTYCASVFGGSTYLQDNPNALYVGKSNATYVFTIVDQKTNTFGDHILLIDSTSKIELVRSERKANHK